MVFKLLGIFLIPLVVSANDLNLTEAFINVRMVSTNYNLDPSVSPCVTKVSEEYGLGEFNVLMEDAIFCDQLLGNCRSVVVEFPESKTIYFTYRGTTQPLQLFWQLPGAISTTDFLGMGQVNRYYVNASAAFWALQQAIVNDPQYADYKFVYTGHSLGGALAILSALRAVKTAGIDQSRVHVMTFGEPRIGHRGFAKKVKDVISNDIRITQNRDIIPRLPPCRRGSLFAFSSNFVCDPSFDNSFYHHGMEYWFYNDNGAGVDYKKCDGLPESEDPSCIAQFGYPSLIGIKPWCDHGVYMNLNMILYGVSGCEIPKIIPNNVTCPIPI